MWVYLPKSVIVRTGEHEMSRVQDEAPPMNREQREWLEKNLAEQQQRHQKVLEEMDQLAAQRDIWVDEFLERLQTRGFNYNCDALRQIPAEEIPVKPDRPFKVNF